MVEEHSSGLADESSETDDQIWHQYTKYPPIFAGVFGIILIGSLYSLFFGDNVFGKLGLLWAVLFWFPGWLWARRRNRTIYGLVQEMRSGSAIASWRIDAAMTASFARYSFIDRVKFHSQCAVLLPCFFVGKHFYDGKEIFDWGEFWFFLGSAAVYAVGSTIGFYLAYQKQKEKPIEVYITPNAAYRTGRITIFKGKLIKANLKGVELVSETPPIIKVSVSERLGPHSGTRYLLLPLNAEQAQTVPALIEELKTSDSGIGKLMGGLGNVLG